MTRATHEPVRVLEQLPDGTVRQQSPLTGTVVWTVPGRSNRPIPSAAPRTAAARCRQPGRRLRLLRRPVPRDPTGAVPAGPRPRRGRAATLARSCTTCPPSSSPTPLRTSGGSPTSSRSSRSSTGMPTTGTRSRRRPLARARDYVATPAGRDHVLAIKRTRMQAAGASAEQVAAESDERLLSRAGDPLRQLARRDRRPPALRRRGDPRRRAGLLRGPHAAGASRLPGADRGCVGGHEPDQPLRPLRRGVPELAAPSRGVVRPPAQAAGRDR